MQFLSSPLPPSLFSIPLPSLPDCAMRESHMDTMGSDHAITSVMQVIIGRAWARTCRHRTQAGMHNSGERERAPPLIMSTALASSVRPRTSRRLRMRDIHVTYADSNSADFAGFKNRLLLKWSQCKHSKKGTVRRDWNDVDNHQDCKRLDRPRLILA